MGAQEASFAMSAKQANMLLSARLSVAAACRQSMQPTLVLPSAVNASVVDSVILQRPPPATYATRGSTQLLVVAAAAPARAGSTATSERRQIVTLASIVSRGNGVAVGPASVQTAR